ncbi:MAG: hypothetical protein HZA78_07585 [Candidatus Schekmanbacteria bacterium]|nr:hypothetical protein [Candidatus Schekmanbacteria bacterium]
MNYGFQSEAATDLSNVVQRFKVGRAYEGPQILLGWGFFNDDNVAEFKIMKKAGAYPLSINDGILVVSGNSSGAYGDLEVNAGAIYYYTMFVKLAGETEFKFDTSCMGKALAVRTGYYQDALWRLIPQVYRVKNGVQIDLEKTLIT